MSNDFPDFDEWKRLSQDQRDYLMWQTLREMSQIPNKYASKRVENIVYGLIGLITSGFITAIAKGVYR